MLPVVALTALSSIAPASGEKLRYSSRNTWRNSLNSCLGRVWSDTSRESVELAVRDSRRGGTRVEAVDADAEADDMAIVRDVAADQTTGEAATNYPERTETGEG